MLIINASSPHSLRTRMLSSLADNLRATVSTRFPTWHSSLHVWNKWFHVVKVESCQEIINLVRT
mgnify:CR=1 FL=1